MAKPTAHLRLFVAIYPPREIASAMAHLAKNLHLPDHRRTPVNQIHLTLQFIGDTPSRQLDQVFESVDRAAAGLEQFALTPVAAIQLPPLGRARVIACETDSPPALLELQRRLAHRLARQPRRRPDDRFRPHLTLARLRPPAPVVLPSIAPEIPSFTVEHVQVMRSTLRPGGAEHIEIHRVKLSA